jgi:hypothetical protein
MVADDAFVLSLFFCFFFFFCEGRGGGVAKETFGRCADTSLVAVGISLTSA